MTTCFQGRVYARRRDGRLLRFRDRKLFDKYRISAHETRRTLQIITRSEFIDEKDAYEAPRWIHSESGHRMTESQHPTWIRNG